jgi:anti-sigma factor RsiW
MNTNDRHAPIDEARWQAQEQAFLAARRGDADADPGDLRIARALRRAPAPALPFDFAAQVAAMARAQAVADSRLEQALLRGLAVVFALSAAVVVAWYGRGWVAGLAAVLPGGSDAVGWSGVAALCVLGNWGFGALRRQIERGSHATA